MSSFSIQSGTSTNADLRTMCYDICDSDKNDCFIDIKGLQAQGIQRLHLRITPSLQYPLRKEAFIDLAQLDLSKKDCVARVKVADNEIHITPMKKSKITMKALKKFFTGSGISIQSAKKNNAFFPKFYVNPSFDRSMTLDYDSQDCQFLNHKNNSKEYIFNRIKNLYEDVIYDFIDGSFDSDKMESYIRAELINLKKGNLKNNNIPTMYQSLAFEEKYIELKEEINQITKELDSIDQPDVLNQTLFEIQALLCALKSFEKIGKEEGFLAPDDQLPPAYNPVFDTNQLIDTSQDIQTTQLPEIKRSNISKVQTPMQNLNLALLLSRNLDIGFATSNQKEVVNTFEDLISDKSLTNKEKKELLKMKEIYDKSKIFKLKKDLKKALSTRNNQKIFTPVLQEHVFIMRVKCDKNGKIYLKVSNSGECGLKSYYVTQDHPHQDNDINKKRANTATYDLTHYFNHHGAEQTAEKLLEIIELDSIQIFYDGINKMGKKQKPKYYQTPQKIGDCTIECFLSDLHDSFENYSTYLKVKIRLLERAFVALEKLTERDMQKLLIINEKDEAVVKLCRNKDPNKLSSEDLSNIKEKILGDTYQRIHKAMCSLSTGKERVAFSDSVANFSLN